MTMYAKIKQMIRLIKKWWFLRKLREDCIGHDSSQPIKFLQMNNKTAVARDAFIIHFVKNPFKRFSWIFFWRKWENQQRLHERMSEYNSIIDSCIRENYIAQQNEINDLATGNLIQNRIFFRTTDLGDDFLGFLPLLQAILSKYASVWTVAASLVVGVYGSSYIKAVFKFISRKIGLVR